MHHLSLGEVPKWSYSCKWFVREVVQTGCLVTDRGEVRRSVAVQGQRGE